jgi:hypothetical protein
MVLVIPPAFQDGGELGSGVIDDRLAKDLACKWTNADKLEQGIKGGRRAEQVGESGKQRSGAGPIVSPAIASGKRCAALTDTLAPVSS